MNEFLRISDQLVIPEDDLIIVNDIHKSQVLTPQGRLFEVLGVKNNHRIVREIACNTVVIGGAIRALGNLLGVTPNWEPSPTHGASSAAENPKLALFGVGTGGATDQFGVVNAPQIWQRDVASRIPLRRGSTISGEDANKYFGKVSAGSGIYNWFYKEFASTPVIKTCKKNTATPDQDGTEITTDITDASQIASGVETFAEITIRLNVSDVREYYESIGGSLAQRYNTIGFFTGTKGGSDYTNVRLYSVVNFNNYDVSTPTQRSLVYRIYSLI